MTATALLRVETKAVRPVIMKVVKKGHVLLHPDETARKGISHQDKTAKRKHLAGPSNC
jgi:hypothetical protein